MCGESQHRQKGASLYLTTSHLTVEYRLYGELTLNICIVHRTSRTSGASTLGLDLLIVTPHCRRSYAAVQFSMTERSGGSARRGAVHQTQSAAEMAALQKRRQGVPVASASVAGSSARPQDGVRQQLAVLGKSHVGYSTMQLDEHGYTVVGARPFSKVGGCEVWGLELFRTGL